MTWMSPSKKNGFTIIELLVVMGIVAVLAALLLTSLSGAKKKSHQAICLSQLRQLGLAVSMYGDEFAERPASMQVLANTRLIQIPATVLCAEDSTKNWGGIYHEESRRVIHPSEPPEKIRYSYINNFSWDRWLLAGLMKAEESNAGVAVCQLHGQRSDRSATPSIANFEGSILRLQQDGAVVQRNLLWKRQGALVYADPWNFFSDRPRAVAAGLKF